MKEFYTKSLTVLCAILFSAISMFAQTGNTCNDAIPIDVNINDCVNTQVSNLGLTNSGQVPVGCSGFAGGDLWFSLVMPPSGEVTFTSSLILPGGTPLLFDMEMAVYSGSCGALVNEGCASDGGGALMPALTFTGTAGSTMFVQMWSDSNSEQEMFNVCATGTPACTNPVANFTPSCIGDNQFEVSVNITDLTGVSSVKITDGTTDFVTGINSTGVHVVGPFSIGSEYTLYVENEADADCYASSDIDGMKLSCENILTCGTPLNQDYCYVNNDDITFLYTSPSGSDVTITFNSGLIHENDEIRIRDGIGGNLLYSELDGGDLAGVEETSTTGQIYIVVHSDPGGSCEDGSLGLGGGWSWTVTCDAAMCDGATNIVSGTSFAQSEVSGNLAGQSFSGFAQCGEAAGTNPDQFFTFEAQGTVQYIRVEVDGDFDPIVQVFDQCDGTPIACVNAVGAGERELFWLTDLTIGQTYAYRVFHNGAGNPSDTEFTTAVAHIPTVQLRSSDCGSTDLVANSIIRATWPNPNYLLDGYIWEFTELEAPFNVYEVNSPNGSNPNFRMFWLDEYEYGRSYSVRVKVRMFQGPNVGEYGPSCTIAMVGEEGSALQPQYEVPEPYELCDIVKAVQVSSATNYRWVFTDNSTLNEFTYNSNSNNYFCPLYNVNGLELGKTYTVTVYVTAGGVESSFSIPRVISTSGNVTNTGLNPSYIACGSTVNITQWTQAFNVCAADHYTFRFTNLTHPEELDIEKVRPNRVISFNQVPGLIEGDTYNVAVKAFVGGMDGDYSTECMITFNEPTGFTSGLVDAGIVANEEEASEESVEVELPALSLYPNPVADKEVMITVTDMKSAQQEVIVRVYDLSGRLMFSELFGNNGSKFNAVLQLDGKISTGVYIVNTTVDGVVLENKKLIVE